MAIELVREERILSYDRSSWEVIYRANGQEVARERTSPDGATKVSGKIPDGLFRVYYPSGKLMKELAYKDGLLNGQARYYSEQGNLIRVMNYLEGKLEGEVKEYDDEGSILYVEYWQNDKRINERRYLH